MLIIIRLMHNESGETPSSRAGFTTIIEALARGKLLASVSEMTRTASKHKL